MNEALSFEIRHDLSAMRDSPFDQVVLRDSLSCSIACVKKNAWANDFDNRLKCKNLSCFAGYLSILPYCSKNLEDHNECAASSTLKSIHYSRPKYRLANAVLTEKDSITFLK